MKVVLFLIFLLLSVTTVFSQGEGEEYFADISVRITESGLVSISGSTNHPTLLVEKSEQLTSKQKGSWILNISTSEVFSDFVYELNLPKGAEINYIDSSGPFRIKADTSDIVVVGTGKNKPLKIIVQYRLSSAEEEKSVGFIWFLVVFAFLFLIILVSYGLLRKRKRGIKNKEWCPAENSPKIDLPKDRVAFDYNPAFFSERQNQILKLLLEADKPLTQKELEEKTGLPKASLSRNIKGLLRKGIVIKEKRGLTNVVMVNKSYKK